MTGTRNLSTDYHDKIDYERVLLRLNSGLHNPLAITRQPVLQLPLHVWRVQEVFRRQMAHPALLQVHGQKDLGSRSSSVRSRLLCHETIRQRRPRLLLLHRLKTQQTQMISIHLINIFLPIIDATSEVEHHLKSRANDSIN